MSFVLVLLAASILPAYWFFLLPRRTRLDSRELVIESRLHTWRYARDTIQVIRPWQPQPTMRLAAVGWPLPPNGWMWSSGTGRFLARASSRDHLKLVELTDGSKLLISLPDGTSVLNP